MELFINKLFEQPAFYFSTIASFAGSICIHEYCHAFVAHHLGDSTAKEGGYMTLNPLKVMGWMSIAALLLFGFSWGAVPVKETIQTDYAAPPFHWQVLFPVFCCCQLLLCFSKVYMPLCQPQRWEASFTTAVCS